MKPYIVFHFLLFLLLSCQSPAPAPENWEMKPFVKADSLNPILVPLASTRFVCPVRESPVRWESKDVFNPATIMKDGKVHMLYRAEDSVGKHNGTSRIGLAVSEDGLHFDRMPAPVFFPDKDSMMRYEWEGGIEDPRVVETLEGAYLMTYTAYDGQTARLCLASSPDLINWSKHGLVLKGHPDLWSKSGSIVCKQLGTRMIATRIQGKYWMYFGDKQLHAATSDDLYHWEPLMEADGRLKVVMDYRPGYFDSDLVEPGPPALLTAQGILLLYNGRNYGPERDPDIPEGTYSAGQVLFDPQDPTHILVRSETNFFRPDQPYEWTGQVNQVVFIQGWVPLYQGRWLLYYGTADSKIAVAAYDPGI